MTISADYRLVKARSLVAKDLLDECENPQPGRRFDQRNMAARMGLDWDIVNVSLQSLYAAGAIRLERNRIIINKNLLQKCL